MKIQDRLGDLLTEPQQLLLLKFLPIDSGQSWLQMGGVLLLVD